MERILESMLYASRWVLAPIYLGLSAGLVLLVVLSLVDMALVGGLLIMVMFSGYENFVSRIDVAEGTEKLSWLGKLDSGSLKQRKWPPPLWRYPPFTCCGLS